MSWLSGLHGQIHAATEAGSDHHAAACAFAAVFVLVAVLQARDGQVAAHVMNARQVNSGPLSNLTSLG